jgi:nucleoside-diphosphate-sugar epimerase
MSGCILVTGATGFVGSHIAEAFVEAGYEVRCGVRASSDPRWISSLPVERVPLYLDRPKSLARALEGAQVVVHAAGITRARQTDAYRSVNADGTARLAIAAVGAGVRRFVLVSSLAARGPDDPSKDGRDHPVSSYGQSKLEAEEHLRALDGQMEIIVLRPAAVYGPRDADMLPLFKMARGGRLILPPSPGLLQPVYATDVARAALSAAASAGYPGFGPFPVAEVSRYTWREVVSGLERAFGRSIRTVRAPTPLFRLAGRAVEMTARAVGSVPIFDERRALDLATHTWTCDPSPTEKALNWHVGVSLYDGLARTARWYREVKWL